MKPDQHERARIVAERVVRRIREVVPAGLGHWGPSWGPVAVPSDMFYDRLREWEAEDSPATRSKLEAASAELIEVWKEVGRRWEAAGRPGFDKIDEKAEVPTDAEAIPT